MNSQCAQTRKDLGVYVLGAIGAAERAQGEQHLATCLRCREELAGLAGLPGLLRRIPKDMATQASIDDTSDPLPGPPLDALIHRVTRIRIRRRLTAAAAAAAAVAVALGASLGLQALHRHATSAPAAVPRWTRTVTADNPATGAWAAVRYANQPWGTEVEVQITGIPAGTRCRLWVINQKGQGIAAGGWTITASRQHPWYPASLPWPAAGLRQFDVSAGGQTLVIAAAPAPAAPSKLPLS
jgi:hypothetical protein